MISFRQAQGAAPNGMLQPDIPAADAENYRRQELAAKFTLPGIDPIGNTNELQEQQRHLLQDIHARDMRQEIEQKQVADTTHPSWTTNPVNYDARNPEPADRVQTPAMQQQAVYDANPAGMQAALLPHSAPALPQHPGISMEAPPSFGSPALPRLMADASRINTTGRPMLSRSRASLSPQTNTATYGVRG